MWRAVVSVAFVFANILPITLKFAHAGIVSGDSIEISKYYALGDFGGGDVVFRFNGVKVSDCAGAWIQPSQPGAKNLIATVLLAKANSTLLRVSLDDSTVWPGSSTKHCKVWAIGLM